jgi:hypothetical protein
MLPPGYTWSLTVIAIILGVLTLAGLRGFSDQKRVVAARRQVKARLFALRLFGDDLHLVLSAQRQLLIWNGRYLGLMLKPAIIMAPPTLLILITLDLVYGHRPLEMGESALVCVRFGNEVDLHTVAAQLDGVNIETVGAPVRVFDAHTEFWRVRAVRFGADPISLHVPGVVITKELVVRDGAHFLPMRRTGSWTDWLIHPGEKLIPGKQVKWIEVAYPSAAIGVVGMEVPWLLWLFCLSAFTMIVLKGWIGVVL